MSNISASFFFSSAIQDQSYGWAFKRFILQGSQVQRYKDSEITNETLRKRITEQIAKLADAEKSKQELEFTFHHSTKLAPTRRRVWMFTLYTIYINTSTYIYNLQTLIYWPTRGTVGPGWGWSRRPGSPCRGRCCAAPRIWTLKEFKEWWPWARLSVNRKICNNYTRKIVMRKNIWSVLILET